MLVSEILLKKEYIEDKIEELQNYISSSNIDLNKRADASRKLFALFNDLQNYKIILNKSNHDNVIRIKDTEVSVADALIVLKTLDNKIKTLTNLLSYGIIDIDEISEQRDKLYDEYMTLLSAIRVKDWTIDVK